MRNVMPNFEIKCLRDPFSMMQIYVHPHHDLWVNTAYHHATNFSKCLFGREVRIYNFLGSALFAELNVCFMKVANKAEKIGLASQLETAAPDISSMEVVELIDAVADQSVLTVYRSQMGDIGIKTGHSKRPNADQGPVVWLACPVTENSDEILKARAELFAPLFDLTKNVADRFNQPNEF